MKTIFAEYNSKRNSIDIYTNTDYLLRIDCWKAEKNLITIRYLIEKSGSDKKLLHKPLPSKHYIRNYHHNY